VVDIYLRVDGVTGESEDAKHKGWIGVDSIAGGVANAGAFAYGSGGGSGKAQWNDLAVRCKFDKSFPILMLKCASGEHIGSVEISASKAGGEQWEFMNVRLEGVLISSVNLSGSEYTEPMFDVGFNFQKITVQGKGQTSMGTMGPAVTGSWNVKDNAII